MAQAIQTVDTAVRQFVKALRERDTHIISIVRANSNRDFIIITKHKRYYFKLCREWKTKDEYNEEPQTIYGTINKDLLQKYDFDTLIICHAEKGYFYFINKERIPVVGKVRTTASQNETVYNIPIKELQRFVT